MNIYYTKDERDKRNDLMTATGAQGAADAGREAPPFQVRGNAALREPAPPDGNRSLPQQRR